MKHFSAFLMLLFLISCSSEISQTDFQLSSSDIIDIQEDPKNINKLIEKYTLELVRIGTTELKTKYYTDKSKKINIAVNEMNIMISIESMNYSNFNSVKESLKMKYDYENFLESFDDSISILQERFDIDTFLAGHVYTTEDERSIILTKGEHDNKPFYSLSIEVFGDSFFEKLKEAK